MATQQIRPAQVAGAASFAASSGDLTLTTSAQDLTGATITITVDSTSDVYVVFATYDTNIQVGGSATAVGALVVDGSTKTGSGLLTTNGGTIRSSVSQTWLVTGLTAGSRIFKLQANKNLNNSTIVMHSGSSTITVIRVA